MKHEYWMDISGHWMPIDQKYFETIIIDYLGRPDGWWHIWVLFRNDQLSIKIKPKPHKNNIGWSRDYNGNFRKVKWVDHF